jgi:hypothetical protein
LGDTPRATDKGGAEAWRFGKAASFYSELPNPWKCSFSIRLVQTCYIVGLILDRERRLSGITVELNAAESDARSTYTLKLWAGEVGDGGVNLGGVMFP